MAEKYINPHTDFGFKRLFGSECNTELLIIDRQKMSYWIFFISSFPQSVWHSRCHGRNQYVD